jgi:hypothetical protein
MNNSWLLLISSFISHGFLDFITFMPNISNSLSLYCISIGGFYTLSLFFPSIITLFFIIISMYHFGEDFRYLSDIFKDKKMRLLCSSGASDAVNSWGDAVEKRWSGVILISSSITLDYSIWVDVLKLLNVSNISLLMNIILGLSIPAIYFVHFNPFFIVVPVVIGCGGGVKGVLLYACCVHTPLSIYRYTQSYHSFWSKLSCLLYWASGTSVVYYSSPIVYYLNGYESYFLKLVISIVISHVIFITRWQIGRDCEAILKNHHMAIKRTILL